MSNQDWSAMVNTTISDYMKGASDNTIRERIFFAMLKNRARIFYNASGLSLTRQVKFALPETVAYTGGMLSFEPSDKYRQLTLEWIGHKVTDTMDELETLKNRGVPALVNRYGMIARDMRQSLEDNFAAELYNSGVTNPTKLGGMETAMGADVSSVAANDRIIKNDGTYGGRATNQGTDGGTWTSALTTKPCAALATDWPSGQGTSEYDYMSPRLIRYNTTGWGTGETDWLTNSERVIRQGIIWSSLTGGKSGRPQICMLSPEMYADYLNRQSAKQTINVPYKEVQDLGFEGAKQEGVSVVTEFGVPADTGYLVNFNRMELHCMYKQLFAVKGPEFDIHTHAWLFASGFFGQMFYEPKFQSKIMAATTT